MVVAGFLVPLFGGASARVDNMYKEAIMKHLKLLLMSIFVLVLTLSCGDSLKYRLTKRLNNFLIALPDEIREKFDNGEYEGAGEALDARLLAVNSYIEKFETEETKKKYIRGNYSGLEKEIKNIGIPREVLDFNKTFYKIVDFECIPTFTGHQVVDYFKVYFKEKLASMK